jgi:hypothetical protein
MSPRAPITVVCGADGGRTHGQSNKHMLVKWVSYKIKKNVPRAQLKPSFIPLASHYLS